MKTAGLLLASLLIGLSAHGQVFVNTDFEDAVVVVNVPEYGWLDWNLAAPGWSHSAGGDTGHIFYYSRHLGTSQCFLLLDSISPTYAPGTQLADQYSLAFSSGHENGADLGSPWVQAYISQTGGIPGGTESLRMLATGPFAVFVGGVEIPMFSLGGNAYGGDVSDFAGTVAELKIMNTSTWNPGEATVVDNIQFSPVAIPEPSTAALFAAGIVAAFLGKQRRD